MHNCIADIPFPQGLRNTGNKWPNINPFAKKKKKSNNNGKFCQFNLFNKKPKIPYPQSYQRPQQKFSFKQMPSDKFRQDTLDKTCYLED